MTERTKIERVGGHLLIGDAAIPIASVIVEPTSVSDPYSIEVSDSGRGSICKMLHWTAREVLEVAYDSAPDEVSDLNATIDDLTRAGLEMERAKDEEIAVLRSNLQCAEETLRRAYEHLVNGRVKEATRIVGAHCPASIREAAKVGR